MAKICKHCKVITEGDYCHICGSHDLIDENNRFIDMKIHATALLYDRSKRLFVIESDEGRYPIISMAELKNLTFSNIPIVMKTLRTLDPLSQREYNKTLFHEKKKDIFVRIDQLFDTIIYIYDRKANILDYDKLLSQLRKDHTVIYDKHNDRFVVGTGQVRIAVSNIKNRNKRSVFIYYILYVGKSWIIIHNRHDHSYIYRKNRPTIIDDIIIAVNTLMSDGVSYIDDLFAQAKEKEISQNDIEFLFDVLQSSGRLSGYMVANMLDGLKDEMSIYDLVMLFLDAESLTDGLSTKEYVAKKAGMVLLGKF